ncbi:MAG: hypothetical protein Q8O67_25540 [Deltaproteobacteria bacterium]|nr:hypothetical protein [Deltaproteobacteria bacterium]
MVTAQKKTTKKTTKKATKKAARKPAKKAAQKPARRAARQPTEAPPSSPAADVRSARVEALRSVFTALGARHPERWARSHVQDGVDQIGRFVFLRALWGRIVKDGRFLDKMRKNQSELTPVVERLLIAGADEDDVTALVRALQVGLLVDLCQLLDDPADNDEGVRWGLWRMDKRGLPLWQLGDLRLDVLDVDPADDV